MRVCARALHRTRALFSTLVHAYGIAEPAPAGPSNPREQPGLQRWHEAPSTARGTHPLYRLSWAVPWQRQAPVDGGVHQTPSRSRAVEDFHRRERQSRGQAPYRVIVERARQRGLARGFGLARLFRDTARTAAFTRPGSCAFLKIFPSPKLYTQRRGSMGFFPELDRWISEGLSRSKPCACLHTALTGSCERDGPRSRNGPRYSLARFASAIGLSRIPQSGRGGPTLCLRKERPPRRPSFSRTRKSILAGRAQRPGCTLP